MIICKFAAADASCAYSEVRPEFGQAEVLRFECFLMVFDMVFDNVLMDDTD